MGIHNICFRREIRQISVLFIGKKKIVLIGGRNIVYIQ